MKIISKYKDYYDYLQGVWGVDEKLVLDRTEYYITPDLNIRWYHPHLSLIRFYICGMVVEGLYYQEKADKDGIFLYGEEISVYLKDRIVSKKSKFDWVNYSTYYRINPFNNKERDIYVLKKPEEFFDLDHNPKGFYIEKNVVECPNHVKNCPILIEEKPESLKYTSPSCNKFPILRDYSLHKAYDAQSMWIMLGEWIGRDRIIVNNQTNSEKVLSNGFDLKTSFRNPIR